MRVKKKGKENFWFCSAFSTSWYWSAKQHPIRSLGRSLPPAADYTTSMCQHLCREIENHLARSLKLEREKWLYSRNRRLLSSSSCPCPAAAKPGATWAPSQMPFAVQSNRLQPNNHKGQNKFQTQQTLSEKRGKKMDDRWQETAASGPTNNSKFCTNFGSFAQVWAGWLARRPRTDGWTFVGGEFVKARWIVWKMGQQRVSVASDNESPTSWNELQSSSSSDRPVSDAWNIATSLREEGFGFRWLCISVGKAAGKRAHCEQGCPVEQLPEKRKQVPLPFHPNYNIRRFRTRWRGNVSRTQTFEDVLKLPHHQDEFPFTTNAKQGKPRESSRRWARTKG